MPTPYHAEQYYIILLKCFPGCISLFGSVYVYLFSSEPKVFEVRIEFLLLFCSATSGADSTVVQKNNDADNNGKSLGILSVDTCNSYI